MIDLQALRESILASLKKQPSGKETETKSRPRKRWMSPVFEAIKVTGNCCICGRELKGSAIHSSEKGDIFCPSDCRSPADRINAPYIPWTTPKTNMRTTSL